MIAVCSPPQTSVDDFLGFAGLSVFMNERWIVGELSRWLATSS